MKTSRAFGWWSYLFIALSVLGGSVLSLSSAHAAAPTSRAVYAFLQGGEIDADLVGDPATPSRDLRVNVWHGREDNDTYRRGEAMTVHFRTNADLYVVVYRIDSDGQVEVLWPTTRYDDGFVYADHTYTLPRPGSPVRLRASQLRGVEYIEAIASEYPFDLRNLAIDFRFDPDARTNYDYEVSGDPFLAVNDINFAITGLDADVEYVVTDWAHLYVESKVEYARYTCRQCHDQDDDEYHPYVDKCSTVNIYNDWGWQTSWYDRFGWYPLYYEPPYYYWDISFGRPYWYPYYPLVYSWPAYSVYSRPYPVYWWYDSPYDYVDYRVRYKKNWRHYRSLYDLDNPRVRRAVRDFDQARGTDRSPVSMRDGLRSRSARGRIDEDRLVRSRMPARKHRGDVGPLVQSRRGGSDLGDRTRSRGGRVRTDLSRRSQTRRLESLPRVRDADRSRDLRNRGERRWTRPVIRNREEPHKGRNRSGSAVDRDRSRRRSESVVDRDRSRRRSGSAVDKDRRRQRSQSEARKDRSGGRERSREVRPPSGERRGRKGGGDVAPTRKEAPRSRGQKVEPTRRQRGSRGGGREVAPSRGSRSPSKSSAPRRSSRKSGGNSRHGSRGRKG